MIIFICLWDLVIFLFLVCCGAANICFKLENMFAEGNEKGRRLHFQEKFFGNWAFWSDDLSLIGEGDDQICGLN
jgi:hypothetical protein